MVHLGLGTENTEQAEQTKIRNRKVDRKYGVVRIDRKYEIYRIDGKYGTDRIDEIDKIDKIDKTGKLDRKYGVARIDRKYGVGRIDRIDKINKIDRKLSTKDAISYCCLIFGSISGPYFLLKQIMNIASLVNKPKKTSLKF